MPTALHACLPGTLTVEAEVPICLWKLWIIGQREKAPFVEAKSGAK